MQNPPPGEQPQGQQPASTGIDKRLGGLLIYLLTIIGGLLGLFVWKNDPDLKFHGARSLVMWGAYIVINILLSIVSAFLHFLWFLSTLWGLLGVVFWIWTSYLVWSNNGGRFNLPLFGGVVDPYAEQISNSIT